MTLSRSTGARLSRRRASLALAIGVVAVGVGTAPQTQSGVQATIHSWLTCEECTDGELDSLLALGEVAVPGLSSALLAGTPDSMLAAIRAALTTTHDRLRQVLPPDSISSLDDYVERFSGNFDALYRSRTALALALIGSPRARRALNMAGDSVALGRFRRDVQEDILFARDSVRARSRRRRRRP